MPQAVDELLAAARARIQRVGPADLAAVIARGGLVIDIRPAAARLAEGTLPGAVAIERTVFEWRLDPASPHRIAEVRGYDQPVVVVCNEGYASSLAAAVLADLGYRWVADLEGGYRAWSAMHPRDR
jgi:rhodanese-related sulfurtransferase